MPSGLFRKTGRLWDESRKGGLFAFRRGMASGLEAYRSAAFAHLVLLWGKAKARPFALLLFP